MNTRVRIGELLLKAGLLAQHQLSAAEAQRRHDAPDRRLVTVLVERGDVTELALVQAISQHMALPWVALRHVDFSPTLLRLVPRKTAEQYCVLPVHVRRESKGPLTLYLAMEDPTWEEPLYTVAVTAGMPVKPMVARRSEIRATIEVNYPRAPVVIVREPSTKRPPPVPLSARAPPDLSGPRPSHAPSRTRPGGER